MKIPENLFSTPKEVGGLQNRNSRIQNLSKKTYSKTVTNYQELLAAITEIIEANKLLANIDTVDFFNGYEIVISDTIVVENTIYLDQYCSGISFVSDGRINIYPKSNLNECFNINGATSLLFDNLYITKNPLDGSNFAAAFLISDSIAKATIRKYGTTIQNCVVESVDFCYISAESIANNILFNRHKTVSVPTLASIYIENSTSNLILGNILDKGLGIGTASSNNRIIGNDIGNGTLGTSTSSGSNFIVGNRNYSLLVTHASDVVVESTPGSGGGAPTTSTYVTLSTDATLTNERVLTAGTNITLTDNGPGSTLVIDASGGGSAPSIGGTITGGTAGSILFVDPAATIAEDNANLYWDNTNNKLAVSPQTAGTPSAKFEVNHRSTSSLTEYVAEFKNSSSTNDAGRLLISQGSTVGLAFQARGTGGVSYSAPIQWITRSTGAVISTPLTLNAGGSVLLGADLIIPEIAAPTTPSAGTNTLYSKTDKNLYYKNNSGVEYKLTDSATFLDWVRW